RGSSLACPHCGGDARCVGYRGKSLLGLLGPMRLERHYYHCQACGHGLCPRDHDLGLTAADLSPAADEAVSLAGAQASFAEAAGKTLSRLAGLRVSESTVERATEAAGRRVGAALADGQVFGAAKDWAWHKDAEGKTVAYVSGDATGVGQQGPGGAAAEGRMAYVGMIYNPGPDDRRQGAHPRGRPPPGRRRRGLGSSRCPNWPCRCGARAGRWGWTGRNAG